MLRNIEFSLNPIIRTFIRVLAGSYAPVICVSHISTNFTQRVTLSDLFILFNETRKRTTSRLIKTPVILNLRLFASRNVWYVSHKKISFHRHFKKGSCEEAWVPVTPAIATSVIWMHHLLASVIPDQRASKKDEAKAFRHSSGLLAGTYVPLVLPAKIAAQPMQQCYGVLISFIWNSIWFRSIVALFPSFICIRSIVRMRITWVGEHWIPISKATSCIDLRRVFRKILRL